MKNKELDPFNGALDNEPTGLPAAGFEENAELKNSRYDIVFVSKLIQDSIKEYLEMHPDEIKENNAQKYAMHKVMQFGRGIYDPSTIKDMVTMEKSCYPKHVILQC